MCLCRVSVDTADTGRVFWRRRIIDHELLLLLSRPLWLSGNFPNNDNNNLVDRVRIRGRSDPATLATVRAIWQSELWEPQFLRLEANDAQATQADDERNNNLAALVNGSQAVPCWCLMGSCKTRGLRLITIGACDHHHHHQAMLELHQHYQQSSSFGPIFLACPAPSYRPGHGWSNLLLGSNSLFDANGEMASLSFGNNHNNNAFGFPFAARPNNAVASLGASDRVRANNGEASSKSTTSSSFGRGAPSGNGGFQANNAAAFPLCASFGGAANASILFGTSSFEHSSSSHHNNNQLPLARTAEREMLSVVKALTDFGNILPTRQPFVVHADHHCLTPCLNFNNNTEERDDNRGSFEGTINAHTKDLVIAAFFGLLHPQSQRLGDITFTTVHGATQQVIALKDLKQSSECMSSSLSLGGRQLGQSTGLFNNQQKQAVVQRQKGRPFFSVEAPRFGRNSSGGSLGGVASHGILVYTSRRQTHHDLGIKNRLPSNCCDGISFMDLSERTMAVSRLRRQQFASYCSSTVL
ncbi:expressed unknown protein [Seminavis robusta]|uniref:Uncharacterized protein n=1 Tax=Seminavis robusta TaxID=568900 RepID=A0A9N8DCA3_9STRA|nr:expressed unknown protein [Seminavis robusta]|eukprot:Sro57_g033210.1 n/a (526) ;mRNA; r:32523-34218